MKKIGALFRYLLNINTVWGLMILAALALTAIQDIEPTTSTFDSKVWQRGENVVDIKVVGKGDAVYETRFTTFTLTNAGMTFPKEYTKPNDKAPYLISIGGINGSTLLKWDCKPWGDYTVTVNGTEAATGKIVTIRRFSDQSMAFAKSAFELAFGFVPAFVLFLGLMKVGEDAGIVNVVAKIIRPIIRFLFPDVPENHPANGAILMNITTSMLGLGNAATPFGLKAMEELQKINPNKDVASDSMIMLMAWNTAGWAFIPLTMIVVRTSAGVKNPMEIILPCMVAGMIATGVGILAVKGLGVLPFFTVNAALAEETGEKEEETEDKTDR